jgi:hypothetical protein
MAMVESMPGPVGCTLSNSHTGKLADTLFVTVLTWQGEVFG